MNCANCHAPATDSQIFCGECGCKLPSATAADVTERPLPRVDVVKRTDPTTERPAPVPPPAAPPPAPPARRRRRSGPVIAVVLGVLAGVAALAGGVYAGMELLAPEERQAEGAASTLPVEGPSTGAVANGADDAAEQEEGQAPALVMRRHWEAIDSGDYAGAFDAFAAPYRAKVNRERWIESQRKFAARARIVSLEFQRLQSAQRAWVYVDVVTLDRGDDSRADAGRCSHFSGRVVVLRESSGWRYYPFASDRTWKERASIDAADPRCSGLS